MIPPLFHRPPKHTIAALYGAIVAQARAPAFYEDYAVPDTVEGRFDMLVLHVVLVVRRLGAGNARQRALSQGLFDAFCRDMDHNLREMGISDQGVPEHMRRVGEAFYGRAQAYEAAYGVREELTDALVRNVYAGATGERLAAAALADYVGEAARCLAAEPLEALETGTVSFPAPARNTATAE